MSSPGHYDPMRGNIAQLLTVERLHSTTLTARLATNLSSVGSMNNTRVVHVDYALEGWRQLPDGRPLYLRRYGCRMILLRYLGLVSSHLIIYKYFHVHVRR